MDSKLLITIVLSLGLLTAVLGFTLWLMKVSRAEEERHKAIPEKAKKWMKAESILGWMSLVAFLALMLKPTQVMVVPFMLVLGSYFICYGIAVYIAERLQDLGLGFTYYGKAARVIGVFIFVFGFSIFSIGLGGAFF